MSDFIKRFGKAKAKTQHWTSIYENCYRWFSPDKENLKHQSEGNTNREHIFDNTPEQSLDTFAARIQATIFPYGTQWVKFKMNKVTEQLLKKVNENVLTQINIGLSDLTDKIFEYINVSNFYSAMNEALHDYGIGTGVLFINELEDINMPFTFKALNPLSVYLEEDVDGLVKTVFSDFTSQYQNIEILFPNAKLSEQLSNKIKEEPTANVEVKQGVIYNNKEKTYSFEVHVEGEKIYEEEMRSNPYIVFRFSKLSNENYGRGPALTSVDDCRVLNEAIKGQLVAAEKSVSEIFVTTQNNMNMGIDNESGQTNKNSTGISKDGFTLEADQLITVRDVNDFVRLPYAGNTNYINENLIQQKQFAIKNKLLAGTVERSDAITRAPEEINAIISERVEDLNAMFARLDTEAVVPTFNRMFDILQRMGLIEDNIVLLSELGLNKDQVILSYQSPLAKYNERMKSNILTQGIQTAIGIFGIENVNASIKMVPSTLEYLKLIDFPLELLNSVEEAEEAKQQQQQQALAQQQQALGGQ